MNRNTPLDLDALNDDLERNGQLHHADVWRLIAELRAARKVVRAVDAAPAEYEAFASRQARPDSTSTHWSSFTLTPEVWKSWKPNRLHESELWESMQLALNGNISAVIGLLRHIKALERDQDA